MGLTNPLMRCLFNLEIKRNITVLNPIDILDWIN